MQLEKDKSMHTTSIVMQKNLLFIVKTVVFSVITVLHAASSSVPSVTIMHIQNHALTDSKIHFNGEKDKTLLVVYIDIKTHHKNMKWFLSQNNIRTRKRQVKIND